MEVKQGLTNRQTDRQTDKLPSHGDN